jgi:hypothetical protein
MFAPHSYLTRDQGLRKIQIFEERAHLIVGRGIKDNLIPSRAWGKPSFCWIPPTLSIALYGYKAANCSFADEFSLWQGIFR